MGSVKYRRDDPGNKLAASGQMLAFMEHMRRLERLFEPWVAPLMRQRRMCQMILLSFVLLAGGQLLDLRLWFCPFAELTGLPCPGCGLTRATLALGTGDWHASLRYHPFAAFFILVGCFAVIGAVAPTERVEKLALAVESFERRTRLPVIFLMLLVGFSLLRMLGFWYHPSNTVQTAPFWRSIIYNRASTNTSHTAQ